MESQISEDDLLQLACSCVQCLKKIGDYEPMCGDTFIIDKKKFRKAVKSFLNQHYKQTGRVDKCPNCGAEDAEPEQCPDCLNWFCCECIDEHRRKCPERD